MRRAGKRAARRRPRARARRSWAATGFVIGLPLDASRAARPPRAAEVRVDRCRALAKRTGYPVRYVDERFTTAARFPEPSTPSAARPAAARATSMRSRPPSCCNMRWLSQTDRHPGARSRRLTSGTASGIGSRKAHSLARRLAAVRLSALGIAAAIAAGMAAACGGEPHGVPEHVVIPLGASFRAAADSLGRAGIVEWPRAFRVYASLTHRDRVLKAGTYLLQRGISWSQGTRDASLTVAAKARAHRSRSPRDGVSLS